MNKWDRWDRADEIIQRHFMPLGVTAEEQEVSFRLIAREALRLGCLAEVENILTRGTFYKMYPGAVGFDRWFHGGESNNTIVIAPDILDTPVWVEIDLEHDDRGLPIPGSKYIKSRMRLRDAIRA